MSRYCITYTYNINLNFYKATKRRKTCTLEIYYAIYYTQPSLQYILDFHKTFFNISHFCIRI